MWVPLQGLNPLLCLLCDSVVGDASTGKRVPGPSPESHGSPLGDGLEAKGYCRTGDKATVLLSTPHDTGISLSHESQDKSDEKQDIRTRTAHTHNKLVFLQEGAFALVKVHGAHHTIRVGPARAAITLDELCRQTGWRHMNTYVNKQKTNTYRSDRGEELQTAWTQSQIGRQRNTHIIGYKPVCAEHLVQATFSPWVSKHTSQRMKPRPCFSTVCETGRTAGYRQP